MALDINPDIQEIFQSSHARGLVCDLTDAQAVQKCVDLAVKTFGGLDILLSNAGLFPASCPIADLSEEQWDKSLALNLSSHQRLLTYCIPYLKEGIDASVVIIGSKNVPAPGPGAAAYSVAKAGLNQLARVAALELAPYGIRVNVIHPNAVFDTAIWTEEVLASRAKSYGLSVDEYKKNNLLKVEISSRDVAELSSAMAGTLFSKITGAQIPLDGGNERVI
jgi:NAD(P)-dependent dehydrogenase (short-subunit alcohol dehydrogenase family)